MYGDIEFHFYSKGTEVSVATMEVFCFIPYLHFTDMTLAAF